MPDLLKTDYKRQFADEHYKNAYLERAECSNCGDVDYFWIRKGLTKPTDPFKCTRCGCKTMEVL